MVKIRKLKRKLKIKGGSGKSIAVDWKKHDRKKKGGLVTRTARANYRAIKQLKRAPTLKFENNATCALRTNWSGQQLSATKINNLGYAFDTRDYVAAGAGNPLPTNLFAPVVLQPWVIQQGERENQRIGGSVKHSHTIMKFTASGITALSNTGVYSNVPQRQMVRFYVVLDTRPGDEATSLGTTTPAYEPVAIPSRLYAPITDDNLVSGGLAANTLNQNMPGFDPLRKGPKIAAPNTANPAGLSTNNLAQKDLEPLSFYSRDFVSRDHARFKVLKVVDLHFSQPTSNQPGADYVAPAKTSASKTVTIKSPWKLDWDNDTRLIPSNRNLLVFCCSNTPVPASVAAGISPDAVAAPSITMQARVLFRG